MDAHLFRLFADAVQPLLEGARIEKIQAPATDILTFSIFSGSRKLQLFFRFSRQEPFCFASVERFSANSAPPAQVMRIRRYFAQKRVAGVVFQYFSRKLWLLAPDSSPEREGDKKAVWLCLDLARGASLHFLEPTETPEPDSPRWPEASELPDALIHWRDWPVLTPPLRKTMSELPLPEQLALMQDLRHGGGDLFLYKERDAEGREKIRKISAWPMPVKMRGNRKEVCETEILPAFEKAGQSIVLEKLHEDKMSRALAPFRRRANRIRKLLPKLDADESRLLAMRAFEPDAAALRDNLWQWPRDFRAPKVSVPDGEGKTREIILDPRHTVRENMSKLFHDASRAKRGLKMLHERRQELLDELGALEGAAVEEPDAPEGEKPVQAGKARPAERALSLEALRKTLPKNVAPYISSDGYVILVGKDAKGNTALRRMSAPHDLWAHVREGSGAHVVIRRPHQGHEVPERTLDEAGGLAALKSWLCNAGSAEIMYAEMRHIKPARSGPQGKVTVDKLACVRNVPVEPALIARLSKS